MEVLTNVITACLALSMLAQQKSVPFAVLGVTEARSPQPVHAKLIRTKRNAYEFFYLVKEGAKKPMALKKIDWRKNNVLVVYPGLVPADARVTVAGLSRQGANLSTSVVVQNARSADTKYPVLLLKVPRQAAGVNADNLVLSTPKIEIKVQE